LRISTFKNIDQKVLPVNSSKNIDIISEEKMGYILKMMDDLSITLNDTYNLSERKKGAIRGVVLALREENIIPNQSLDVLVNHIASRIGLKINSKLDSSTISDDYEKKAKSYVKNNPYK